MESPGRSDSASISQRPWLEALLTAARAVCASREAEPVHQLRVACARLRTWLKLNRSDTPLRRQLRALRASAAPVRDIDVHLQKRPPPALATRLRRQRRWVQHSLVLVLQSPGFAKLCRDLTRVAPLPATQAARATRKLARRVLASKRKWKSVSSLHRLRRRIRGLRYALEWQNLPTAELVALQDLLGDACDCAVARKAAKGQGRTRRFRKGLKRDEAVARQRARSEWQVVRPRLLALVRATPA